MSKKCAKCNKRVIALGSTSGPGTTAARRKLCFQVKLVSWHVISWGEFLIHDLMKICQSSRCYRFLPSCHLSLSLFLLLCPCVFFLLAKKVKDSRCGTPLLLDQLPHRCIILPNVTSLFPLNPSPSLLLSLPHLHPRHFVFFHLFPSSLQPRSASAHQLQQQQWAASSGNSHRRSSCMQEACSWLTRHRVFSQSQTHHLRESDSQAPLEAQCYWLCTAKHSLQLALYLPDTSLLSEHAERLVDR